MVTARGVAKLGRLSAVAFAVGLCFLPSFGQQSAGSISVKAKQGDTIVVDSKETGITRRVTAGQAGSVVVPQLPPGTYTVELTRADGTKQTQTVSVAGGAGTVAEFAEALGRTEVVARRLTLDTKSTESSTVLTKQELDRIPVARDTTSITLLAPGALQGDSRIGSTQTRSSNIASLGGASPAENAYYINGFNVTNIVNGVAFNTVPYEGVASQQVKTGGYGAEFGRSLGGVISVTTKRGTNEWHGGANVQYSPDSLRGSSVYTEKDANGDWILKDRPGKNETTELNFWAGGPLIADKLFIFGLVNQKRQVIETYGASTQTRLTSQAPQYLLKVDWNITANNLLEFTSFNDKTKDKSQDWTSPVQYETPKGADLGDSTLTQGGQNSILKWTSWITDDLSLSAMYGMGKFSREADTAGADCPIVQDRLTSTILSLGCWTGNGLIVNPLAKDKREAYRLDLQWTLGKHTLRAGLDNETYTVIDGTSYSGGGLYQARVLNPGQTLANGYTNTGTTPIQYVRFRHLENGGTFKTENAAWYIEDGWQVTNRVLVTAGLRNESFTNKNADGVAFIKVDNTWAPRLGAAWDVTGKSDFKVYGNLGRYYIPVYANTNVRLSGKELDYQDFYEYGGSFSNDRFQVPALGNQLGSRVYTSDGATPNPLSVVDPDIKPMFQDEFILGFQKAINDKMSFGVKYTNRRLKNGMDDICNDEGPTAWALANGYTATQAANIGAAIGHCFLYNPGKDLKANVDLDGTGQLTAINIPASALQMPDPKRKYDALEFSFDRAWDNKWTVQASYVLAWSRGNTEGYVKSDIGQDDAGISQDFDYPGLMEGSEGWLPNDRRHTFKVFGAYALTDEWRVGANLLVQSGRPKNCFGVYGGTLDGVSQLYGDASFWCGGKLNPRGSLGRLPWTRELSLSGEYLPRAVKGLSFKVDVLNVFNSRTVRGIDEQESSGINDPASTYGRPILGSIQSPRRVKFTAQYEF